MEWENAELKGQLLGVKQERDSALRKSQGLQSKLESLEQVLKVRAPAGALMRQVEDQGVLVLPALCRFQSEAGGSRGPPVLGLP